MSNCYNNYDLLTIINLLSNRSFKDLYQYPIFPMLYKPFCEINNINDTNITKERDYSIHIGLQTVNDTAKKRKEKIIKKYIDSEEDIFGLFKRNFSTFNFTLDFLTIILSKNFE